DDALAIDVTDGAASDIVYSFTITNTSSTDAMNAAISAITVGTNLQLTSVTQDGAALTEANDAYALTPIAATEDATLVLTFNVVDESSSIESADIQFNLALTSPNA
ncbi:MAG: hypothetical protein IKB21_04110, partial [Clostridia bacterium]|nr:hypothetical protein [Clostridia bacterium]